MGGIRMAARRYELSDTQWERIKDMIPRAKTGRPPKDDRLMLNAMLWLARSGAAFHHVVDQSAVETVLGAVLDVVARTGKYYMVAFYADMEIGIHGLLELAVFALDCYYVGLVINRNGHPCRDFDGSFTYS